jgi:ankyrin repeat protein/catechol 2,3-dioxygenase-like lactoylglutathione lyase family enzyme
MTFFEACTKGEVETLHALLANDPSLVRATRTHPDTSFGGWTGLHEAAARGHLAVVRLLLEQGADANAREAGDNTTPLHWAAAHGHVDVVRALLDADADVQGTGDLHEMAVIGWATGGDRPPAVPPRDLVALLLERGARHHIFSAMAMGDLDLIRTVVNADPQALTRRMSRFEQGQTALHVAVNRQRYDMLDLLIALGADLEARDDRGQTALTVAMLRGDREAMVRLRAAGAQPPEIGDAGDLKGRMTTLAKSVGKAVPMIYVPDVARALEWYTSIGFTEVDRVAADGVVNFGMLAYGNAELMLNIHGHERPHDASLWFYTDQIDALYQTLKSHQLAAAQARLDGLPGPALSIDFEQELEDMFYGARQFCIRDPNGYQLYFIQSTDTDGSG